MNLHEYQAKEIFARFGIPVPQGALASSPEAARAAAKQIGGSKFVVKGQVHAGGRGLPVNSVWVEKPSAIARELYVSGLVDRSRERLVFMASAAGGMDIEEVAEHTPEK